MRVILAEELTVGLQIKIPDLDEADNIIFIWKKIRLAHTCEHCTIIICVDDSIYHFEHHDKIEVK